jgi:hypothetical protein
MLTKEERATLAREADTLLMCGVRWRDDEGRL